MRPQDIIARKRDGHALTDGEIAAFVGGVCDGSWADYQVTALIMAMFIRGLGQREQDTITREMLHSGTVMDLSDIDAPKADKHSTGGVGDKTSLIIAPVLAACGIAVPMISGRGLGHTGGTLDKLESIPGYNVNLPFRKAKAAIRECGLALVGQTRQIAPADKKIYALRDATATVPYIPLIVASIMSKKLAEGLDALVLDVKTGAGAFIKDLAGSKRLASALCSTGRAFRVHTEALVTDMSEPLGRWVGNSVEVYECLKIMRGEAEPSMHATADLSATLSANLLIQCGIERTAAGARRKVDAAITSGEALERFRRNVEIQGGDPRICDKPEMLLEKGLSELPIVAPASGYLTSVDSLAVGEAVAELGGGRIKASDKVDHAVGYSCERKVGEKVRKGDVLAVVSARSASDAASVSEKLQKAYRISAEKPIARKLILAKVK